MRDIKLKLRMAMLDDFGREVGLDLATMAHSEMQTEPVIFATRKTKKDLEKKDS